jgi:hypothetical protein
MSNNTNDKPYSYISETDEDVADLNEQLKIIEETVQTCKINAKQRRILDAELDKLHIDRITFKRVLIKLEGIKTETRKQELEISKGKVKAELEKIKKDIKEKTNTDVGLEEASKRLIPTIRDTFNRIITTWARITNGYRGSPSNIIEATRVTISYLHELTGRVDFDEGTYTITIFSEWLIFFKQLIISTFSNHLKLTFQDRLKLEQQLINRQQQRRQNIKDKAASILYRKSDT